MRYQLNQTPWLMTPLSRGPLWSPPRGRRALSSMSTESGNPWAMRGDSQRYLWDRLVDAPNKNELSRLYPFAVIAAGKELARLGVNGRSVRVKKFGSGQAPEPGTSGNTLPAAAISGVTAAALWAKDHEPASELGQLGYLLEAQRLLASLGWKA